MNKNHQDLHLLPNYFKKVAFGIIILSFLLIVLTISKVIPVDKDIIKNISKTGFLISLLLLTLSKNKTEDELTSRIRLRAFAGSFIFGVVYVILHQFERLLFNVDLLSDKGEIEILTSMLLFYFGIFYLMLKKR